MSILKSDGRTGLSLGFVFFRFSLFYFLWSTLARWRRVNLTVLASYRRVL